MNKVILSGRLTADPELKSTQSNVSVCRFRLAVDRYMGEGKENDADFITCTAWGKTAEHISKFYFKGKKALIEGNLRTGSYKDKDDKTVYTTEIWVDRIEFADDKKRDEKRDENGNGQAPQQSAGKNDAPPWDTSADDFPRDNGLPVQKNTTAKEVNETLPPWMR